MRSGERARHTVYLTQWHSGHSIGAGSVTLSPCRDRARAKGTSVPIDYHLPMLRFVRVSKDNRKARFNGPQEDEQARKESGTREGQDKRKKGVRRME